MKTSGRVKDGARPEVHTSDLNNRLGTPSPPKQEGVTSRVPAPNGLARLIPSVPAPQRPDEVDGTRTTLRKSSLRTKYLGENLCVAQVWSADSNNVTQAGPRNITIFAREAVFA